MEDLYDGLDDIHEPTSTDPLVPGWLEDAVTFQVVDLTGDAIVDVAVSQLATGEIIVLSDDDFDGDIDSVAIDLDGDGVAELLVSETSHGFLLLVDEDDDGVFEHEATLTADELTLHLPDVAEILGGWFGAVEPEVVDVTAAWVEDGQLIGDPDGDAEFWFTQAQNGFCVPASVAQIVAEYTGEPFEDEAAFVELANELGVFQVGMDGVPGITIDGAHELLEAAGVPAEVITEADLGTLENLLDEGHSVMLFVDSGEYWEGEAVEDFAMDHAVVLTGIDHANGVVILSDPGTPDGNALQVPLDTFLDAWDDSYNTLLVSEQPAPDSAIEYGLVDQTGTRPEMEVTTAPPAAGESPLLDRDGTDRPFPSSGYLSHEPNQLEQVTSWVMDHPWVIIPVAIGIRTLVSRNS